MKKRYKIKLAPRRIVILPVTDGKYNFFGTLKDAIKLANETLKS